MLPRLTGRTDRGAKLTLAYHGRGSRHQSAGPLRLGTHGSYARCTPAEVCARVWPRCAANLLLAVCLALAGCATYVPFTEQMRVSLSRAQVACLQYYLSDEVILEREAGDALTGVEDGELVTREGQVIHVVTVERMAKARVIADTVVSNQMGVRFGDEQPTPLRFGARPGPLFALNGQNEGGSFYVRYGNYLYRVVSTSEAHLLIRDDAIRRETAERTSLDGESLDPDEVLTLEDLTDADDSIRVTIDPISDRCVETHTRYFENR